MKSPTEHLTVAVSIIGLAMICLMAQLVIERGLDWGSVARADDGWNPFAELDRAKARRAKKRRTKRAGRTDAAQPPPLAPMNGSRSRQVSPINRGFSAGARQSGRGAPYLGANSTVVQSSELAPLSAPSAPPAVPPTVAVSPRPQYNRRANNRGSAQQPARGGWEVGTYREGDRRDGRQRNDRMREGRQQGFDRRNLPQGAALNDRGFDRNRQQSNSRHRAPQQSQPFEPRVEGFRASPWQGIDVKQTEALISGLQIPPRSKVMHGLWRKLWLSEGLPDRARGPDRVQGMGSRSLRDARRFTDGGTSTSTRPEYTAALNGNIHFQALRLEALYRSGLIAEVASVAAQSRDSTDPVLATLHARALIGLGKRDEGCRVVADSVKPGRGLPRSINGTAILVSGYCAAVARKPEAAGLFADLAREENIASPLALAVLDAIASGRKPELSIPKRMTLIDYRFVQLASSANPMRILDRAEPALLAALALDKNAKPEVRLAAGERAARLLTITDRDLAVIYNVQRFNSNDIADPLPTRSAAPQRRALLFQAITRERDDRRLAGLIQAHWDLAKRDGLRTTTAELLAKRLVAMPVGQIGGGQAGGGFTQTAIEIALIAGYTNRARVWARAGRGGYRNNGGDRERNAGGQQQRQANDHWLGLVDIADEQDSRERGAHLPMLADLARAGRFKSDQLHRLATVLDALEYNVPIPLWEAASRTPQPKGGHLPKTGILPQLAKAAAARQIGHTILLSLHSLGAGDSSQMHMIALGDTIRALKRAGMQVEARQLAVEALIGAWPRAVNQR